MPRKKHYLPAANHALLDAIEAAVMPQIAKAGLKTIKIDGKAVAVDEAPLADLVLALNALNPIAENAEQSSEQVQAMADIANRLEKAESDLNVANAVAAGLRVEVRDLTTRADTAESTVQRMAAERQSLDLEVKSLKSENTRVTGEFLGERDALCELFLETGGLTDLRDAKGAIVASTAPKAEQIAAASLLKAPERKAAVKGSLNRAIMQSGVGHEQIPATSGTGTAGAPGTKAQTITERCLAEVAKNKK